MSVNGDGTMPASDGPNGPNGRSAMPPTGHRPWLAPAVACLVAALVLLFLLVPGVLRYAEAPPIPTAPYTPPPAALRDANRALEERIASLRRLLDAQVCVADGAYRIPDGPNAAALQPQDRAALPQPDAARTPVPLQSVPAQPAPSQSAPGAQPFSGSLLDLLDQATVLVLQSAGNGKVEGSGTGFFVAPGVILTNRHVTAGEAGRTIHVVSRATGVVAAEILAESADGEPGSPDFAILRVAGGGTGTAVPLSFAPPAERLTNVIASGYPGMVLDTDEGFQRLIRGQGNAVPAAAVTEGVVTAV